MTAVLERTRRHGTNSCYQSGCRQPDCRKAHNDYQLAWKTRHRNGEQVTVDAQGSRRRLQALMALGWPRRTLAARMGYADDSFGEILGEPRRLRRRLTAQLHHRICAVYDDLCMTPGPSAASRRVAAAKGWPPPLAWDDIDTDPEPTGVASRTDDHHTGGDDLVDDVVIQRILSCDVVPANLPERLAVIERWRQLGQSMRTLEDFTGWNVYRDLRKHPPAQEVA